MPEQEKYYDWQKTLSYDARINMIITARGRGKTYGIRKQAVLYDYMRHGYRFVEVVRYKAQLDTIEKDYFAKLKKLERELDDYDFKIKKHVAYIAKKIPDSENHEEWQIIGYFVALTDQQFAKANTYIDVKRVIFDEAILEASDRYHDYLPSEWYRLSNLIDTLAREDAYEGGSPIRLYMLGNACDGHMSLVSPVFQAFKIYKEPKRGYSWYGGKLLLLHFEDNQDYSEAKAENTLAGRMLSMTEEGQAMIYNTFSDSADDFICEKMPDTATFDFAISYENVLYGVWSDYAEGYMHVRRKPPKDARVYVLTTKEQRPNYIVAKRSNKVFKMIADLSAAGLVLYDTPTTRAVTMRMLVQFGLR